MAETIAAVISAVGKTGAAATRVATVVTTSRLVMTNVVVPTGTKTNALGRGREEDADELSCTMESNPSVSPSQVSNVSDASALLILHLAEAERQEEEMDESIYVMEIDPSASSSQESNGSVASSDGSDFLEDHYCTEAVRKREAAASPSGLELDKETDESLISAEGPAVDTKGDTENSGGKSVSEKRTANN